MKKIALTIFTFLLILSISYAQNTEKIKGNRNVTLVNTVLKPFHTIIIDQDFKIDLIYNKMPAAEVETDENLQEVIKFKVKDSVLTIGTSKKITSKKKLLIKVSYGNTLRNIETRDKAEVNGLTTLYLDQGYLKSSGTSKVGLTLKSKDFSFRGTEKSQVKLNLTTDVCKLDISNSSEFEALINAKEVSCSQDEKGKAIIEGDCDIANINLNGNTDFIGKNFAINSCKFSSKSTGDAYLEVKKDIAINITESGTTYLYNNPKITIDAMEGTTKIVKKIK